ncbi:hypothetical protein FB446DRAFT_152227 [Lentinula raphanica]|nr:hypothetical protein FB446DRAFT_152227 [Lentinula raphanica]
MSSLSISTSNKPRSKLAMIYVVFMGIGHVLTSPVFHTANGPLRLLERPFRMLSVPTSMASDELDKSIPMKAVREREGRLEDGIYIVSHAIGSVNQRNMIYFNFPALNVNALIKLDYAYYDHKVGTGDLVHIDNPCVIGKPKTTTGDLFGSHTQYGVLSKRIVDRERYLELVGIPFQRSIVDGGTEMDYIAFLMKKLKIDIEKHTVYQEWLHQYKTHAGDLLNQHLRGLLTDEEKLKFDHGEKICLQENEDTSANSTH